MALANLNTVLVGIWLLGTMSAASQWRETKVDILTLTDCVYRATESAKAIYDRQFCNPFITNESYLQRRYMPPLIQPSTVTPHNESARDEFMADMTVTISKYHHLVSHEMKYEKASVCLPAIGKRKCKYPKLCNEVKDKGLEKFYCKLHYVESFLHDFNYYLKGLMPSVTVPKTHTNELAILKDLPESYRRCYTLGILNSILKQLNAFKKVMSTL